MAVCLEFQKDISERENDRALTLLEEKELLQNEIDDLSKKHNALKNSMLAFVEEILEDLQGSISGSSTERECKIRPFFCSFFWQEGRRKEATLLDEGEDGPTSRSKVELPVQTDHAKKKRKRSSQRGCFALSLTSRLSSALLLNPPVPEDLELREWYNGNKDELKLLFEAKTYKDPTILLHPPKEEDIVDIEKAMAASETKKTAWVRGLPKLIDGQTKYWFTACMNCQKAINAEVDWNITCPSCKEHTLVELRLATTALHSNNKIIKGESSSSATGVKRSLAFAENVVETETMPPQMTSPPNSPKKTRQPAQTSPTEEPAPKRNIEESPAKKSKEDLE